MTVQVKPVTVDLRDSDFGTIAELQEIVAEIQWNVAAENSDMTVGGIVITEAQQKKLRLERYLRGVPQKQIKNEFINQINNVPVMITKFEKGCPGCGDKVHWH